jgi:tetratricopeptide (TPR) repeat protein
MFGRSSPAHLKNAEDTLSQGRLDDACQLVSAHQLQRDKKASPLLERLADALMLRGQDRLLARKFDDALADFDRAGECGMDGRKVAEWRNRALDARGHNAAVADRQQAVINDARRHLAAGSIDAAADARARAPVENSEVGALSQAIHGQVERAEAALAAVRPAVKDGNLLLAVQQFRTARALHAKLDGLAEAETMILDRVIDEATKEYQAGRLRRARQRIAELADLGRSRSDRIDMDEALRLAEAAARALADDHFTKAGVLMGRLTRVGPRADWLADVRERLDALTEHRKALLEGPLGLLSENNVPANVMTQAGVSADTVSRPISPARKGPPPVPSIPSEQASQLCGVLPSRIVFRIDGVGSFLLLRGDRIAIGRAGSGHADLELISDLSDRHAELIRAGEDYFIVSSKGVELAGKAVEHALLQDGDRIRLGSRVRMTFRRPSLKSMAAALDLGEGVRTSGDCRRVILWNGPILMGSTKECHIQLRPSLGGFVLMERAGQMMAKPMGPDGSPVHLPLGVLTNMGDLRLSVSGLDRAGGVGRVIG